MSKKIDYESNEEIKILREYLMIPSVHPNIDYEKCLNFIKNQADGLQLPYQVFHPNDPRKPVIILTWTGSDPILPSIFLNSHMDVVPVFEEHWSHPPFAAEIDDEGKIFARGTQDMKSFGMLYLAGIRKLKKDGYVPKRTTHICFVSEEEVEDPTMKHFVQTNDFKALNIGFALDEADVTETNQFNVFYAERATWQITFEINGAPGHGMMLMSNTAGEKANYLVNKLMEYRKIQLEKYENEGSIASKMAEFTTVNLTKMIGGVQNNVIPPQFKITFDIRLAIDVNHEEFESKIRQWCSEAGDDIEIVFNLKEPFIPPTEINDSNKYFRVFKDTLENLGHKVVFCVSPGASDARYLRAQGIPAFGFASIKNTPVLLHDHDEYIRADSYLESIGIYSELIRNLTSLT